MFFHCRLPILALLAALVSGCAAPMTQRLAVSDSATKAEAQKQFEIAVHDLVADQRRLSKIYWLLSTRSHAMCGDQIGPHVGAFVMSKPKNELGAALERLYGIRDRATVLFLEESGPAARAGLRQGDVVQTINGVPTDDASAMAELRDTIPPDAPIQLEVKRGGQTFAAVVTPTRGCRFHATVSQQQIINAFADGKNIIIARGMMNFAREDRELALVVAHEMAHNIMRHLDARKQNMGVGLLADLAVILLSRGQVTNTNFTQIGAQAYSQEFEAEADYVGLYILANAGLPVDDAPNFWRRMASAHPGSIKTNHAATHPSTAERMVALEAAVKEIKQKVALGTPLHPTMKDGKSFTSAVASSAASTDSQAPAIVPQASVMPALTPVNAVGYGDPRDRMNRKVEPEAKPESKPGKYEVEQLAKAEHCSNTPSVKLVASGAGFENYSVSCANGDALAVRCEMGNCRALK